MYNSLELIKGLVAIFANFIFIKGVRMRKRGKLVTCICAMIACIAVVCVGVFAATKPELQITGSISYEASDVNVLVLGKLNGVKNSSGTAISNDYPNANVDGDTYAKNTKLQTTGQYLDYTDETNDTMATWKIGSVKFYTNSDNMLKTASICIKVTNFSDFSVKVDIVPNVTDSGLSAKNVTRIQNKSSFILEGVSTGYNSDEYCVYFNVADQSQNITSFDIGFKVTMKRYFHEDSENDGYTFTPIKQTSASPLTYALWQTSDGISALAGARLTKFDNNSTYGNELVIPNTTMVDTNGDGVNDTCVPVLEVGDASASVATTNANLTSIEIGSFVKKINANALKNLNNVDLALPSSLEIASQSFVSGTIKNLVIASSAEMTTSANDYSVTGKIVADGTRYTSFNGQVLCDLTSKRIVKCSKQATELNLTQSDATTVDDYAFSQCTNLAALVLPESISTAGTNSFAGCSALKNSSNLIDGVYYVGTASNPKKFQLS